MVVIVYAAIDENGLGKGGKRYRIANSAAGVELMPEFESNLLDSDRRVLYVLWKINRIADFPLPVPSFIEVCACATHSHEQCTLACPTRWTFSPAGWRDAEADACYRPARTGKLG